MDSLLLSRCDFLLHSASGVAEFAIYWGPHLHEASVHLQYPKQRQVPRWMPTAGQVATGHAGSSTGRAKGAGHKGGKRRRGQRTRRHGGS